MEEKECVEYKVKFKPHWIEMIDDSVYLLYSDTDSQYTYLKLPFNKFDDVNQTVNYAQDKAKEINNTYLKILNTRLSDRAGLDPDFNPMNFKSEVVAYRGFFKSKKYYALAKLWDEGNFFSKPKMKKTGGQIRKADSSKIVLDLLNEVYNKLVLDFDITDENKLANEIFVNISKKYKNKIKQDINNFNLSSFCIPKKWGNKTLKTIPTQVLGAMFYNTIVKNTIRPGDSIVVVQIKIKSLKKILNLDFSKFDQYQLDKSLVNNKLNILSLPAGEYNTPEKTKELFDILMSYEIELDFDKIVEFNIDMKLDQFKDLFDKNTLNNLK